MEKYSQEWDNVIIEEVHKPGGLFKDDHGQDHLYFKEGADKYEKQENCQKTKSN